MSVSPDRRAETRIGNELRPTTPDAITAYFDTHFDAQVRVEFAHKGELITIKDGWHGAGKEGEALVHVGNLLTEQIAGTQLSAKDFLQWSLKEEFSLLDSQNHQMTPGTAIRLLEGNGFSAGNAPMLRLTRVGPGTPVEVQFYAGASNPKLKTLSEIGNKDLKQVSRSDKDVYRDAVLQLFRPFISKGTKEERARLRLHSNVDILRRVDDCTASGVTFIGDQLLDDAMQISRDNLVEVHDLSVASLQAVVLAITMAQRRHVPLIMRIGAPAFGLGSSKQLNYIMNTLPEMKTYGPLTLGDMGTLMDDGESAVAKPRLESTKPGDPSREMRLFLGGGLPVAKMVRDVHEARGKTFGWNLAIRRGSRVDNGPGEWAVLISGKDVSERAARRDKFYIYPGTELSDHEYMPFNVGASGLWASRGREEGGLIPVTFIDRGTPVTLYLPEKAK